MQSGWLESFAVKSRSRASENEVSRRDFLHTGVVSGVAAGGAGGGTLPCGTTLNE